MTPGDANRYIAQRRENEYRREVDRFINGQPTKSQPFILGLEPEENSTGRERGPENVDNLFYFDPNRTW